MREATHIWEEHSIKKRHMSKKKKKKKKGKENKEAKIRVSKNKLASLLYSPPPPTFFRSNIIPKGVNSI